MLQVLFFHGKPMAKYKKVRKKKPLDDLQCPCPSIRKDYVICIICGLLLFAFTVSTVENWRLRVQTALNSEAFAGILAYSSASDKDIVSKEYIF